jgi:hypothetical protein
MYHNGVTSLKKLTGLIAVVLLLAACSSNGAAESTSSASLKPSETGVVNDAKFVELIIYEAGSANAKGGEWVEFSFPRIFAENNGVATDQIVTSLNTSVTDRVAAAQERAESAGEPVTGWEYELEIRVSDVYSDENLLVVNFTGFEYFGTAHGETYKWTKAYRVANQSEIQLRDEFAESEWAALINLVAEELEYSYKNSLFERGAKLREQLSKLEDVSAWEISSQGLRMWLPAYEVTAGFAGEPQVDIGWSQLDRLLDAESVLRLAYPAQVNSECDDAFPGVDLETCE